MKSAVFVESSLTELVQPANFLAMTAHYVSGKCNCGIMLTLVVIGKCAHSFHMVGSKVIRDVEVY